MQLHLCIGSQPPPSRNVDVTKDQGWPPSCQLIRCFGDKPFGGFAAGQSGECVDPAVGGN